jgi:hypothetical protein
MAWVEQHGDGFRVRYRLDDGTIFTENGFTTQDAADNRAADVESDQRRHRFVDPRLASADSSRTCCAVSTPARQRPHPGGKPSDFPHVPAIARPPSHLHAADSG